MSEQVLCDGVWLATLGGVGDLNWSTTADGGSESASWGMNLPASFAHPALLAGALVEIRLGPKNIWSGTLAEPDRSGEYLTFNAAGLAAEGDRYLCFDALLNTTSNPDEAIDEAIDRGLRWTRPESLSNDYFAATATTDALNYVSALLTAWAQTESKRWGVDPDFSVYARTDPTIPSWHMTPGAGKVGLTDDEYASDLFVRYVNPAGSYATVQVSDVVASVRNRSEQGVDGTALGAITTAKATSHGQGAIARGKARYAWTSSVNPTRFQITTPGGTPADLRLVRGGQMVRMFGVLDEQNIPIPYIDFVIGRTDYQAGADTITLAPTRLAARTLGDVLQIVSG